MGVLWKNSNSLEFSSGVPALAAKAYFYEGGTTTPLTVFEDAAETTPRTDPVLADGNGRWPTVFIPFTTSYDLKVTTSGGTQLYYPREIPNLDPVEAAADTVTASEKWATGDIKIAPKTGTYSGYVRLNGRTIGSAASGATERANADCADLYAYNWDNFADAILPVTSGRGASAAADFAANKPIALLDGRGATLRGVDDMGNTAASLLGLATFTTGNATTGGSIAGANTHVLTTAQAPAHTHAISITSASDGAHTHTGTVDSGGAHVHAVTDPGHVHDVESLASGAGSTSGLTRTSIGATLASIGNAAISKVTGVTVDSGGSHTHTFTTASSGAHTHAVTGTSASTGSDTAHNNVSRSILLNLLQKL